jgi:hypothetical protein
MSEMRGTIDNSEQRVHQQVIVDTKSGPDDITNSTMELTANYGVSRSIALLRPQRTQ